MRPKVLRPSLTATIIHVEPDPDPDNEDVYGTPGTTSTMFTTLCEIQQIGRSEQTTDANIQVGDWDFYGEPRGLDEDGEPVDVELAGPDEVEIAGQPYQVIGDPWFVRNMRTGEIELIRATLRRTKL